MANKFFEITKALLFAMKMASSNVSMTRVLKSFKMKRLVNIKKSTIKDMKFRKLTERMSDLIVKDIASRRITMGESLFMIRTTVSLRLMRMVI